MINYKFMRTLISLWQEIRKSNINFYFENCLLNYPLWGLVSTDAVIHSNERSLSLLRWVWWQTQSKTCQENIERCLDFGLRKSFIFLITHFAWIVENRYQTTFHIYHTGTEYFFESIIWNIDEYDECDISHHSSIKRTPLTQFARIRCVPSPNPYLFFLVCKFLSQKFSPGFLTPPPKKFSLYRIFTGGSAAGFLGGWDAFQSPSAIGNLHYQWEKAFPSWADVMLYRR